MRQTRKTDGPAAEADLIVETDALLRELSSLGWGKDPKNQGEMLSRPGSAANSEPRGRGGAAAGVPGSDQASRRAVPLLERDDIGELLLSKEEIEPHWPVLNECWQRAQDTLPSLGAGGPPNEPDRQAFARMVQPVLGKMADSIFTPERMEKLQSQLRAFQEKKLAAGDPRTAEMAQAALTSIMGESQPGKNQFLFGLCYRSVIDFTQKQERRVNEPKYDM